MLLVLVPVLLPTWSRWRRAGYFGVVIVFNITIGLVTRPTACCSSSSALTKIPLGGIMRVQGLIGSMIVALALLVAFPAW
jgi:TRAP-type C4-dicarboxylate transport system permease large subunit